MRTILASASPRRRELLAQIGLSFEILVTDVEEKSTAILPGEIVEELSRQKAEACLGRLEQEGKTDEELLIIAADTVVACDGRILGKPRDEEEACCMLRNLQGRSHQVYTGVTLILLRENSTLLRTFHEATEVVFCPMTEAEIREYAASGDCLDKAGSYGIQGFCARYISGIRGDYNNVVGLPVCRLYQELKGMI